MLEAELRAGKEVEKTAVESLLLLRFQKISLRQLSKQQRSKQLQSPSETVASNRQYSFPLLAKPLPALKPGDTALKR